MFAFKSKQIKKEDEVLNHWIASADDFALPPEEFYTAAEQAIAALKIPGLEISRKEYAEGGLLSDNRVYFRLIRERLAFDVCAAPFGTRYFFSCRTVYSPVVLKLWHVLMVIGWLAGIFYGLTKYLSLEMAGIALGSLVLALGLMFRNVVAAGLNDIDSLLLKIPALGPIYEHFFRKDTYYRQDTRLMYLDTVPAVIQGLADHFTGTKGVKLVRQYQIAPILGELYKPLPPRKPEADPEA
ncbi:MAG: hypothetical protein RLZZ350_43 [Verrucomicrobiota bacterium]|jgi:hypothetical protein